MTQCLGHLTTMLEVLGSKSKLAQNVLTDWFIDWLSILLFTARSRIAYAYMFSAQGLWAGRYSLSCHTCCETGPLIFRSYPNDHSIQPPLPTHKEMWRIYTNSDRQESPISHLLQNARRCWGPIPAPNLYESFSYCKCIIYYYTIFMHNQDLSKYGTLR
jgi:hypothetical protein